jgi:thiol:disulfide interchange protein DsbA
MRSLRTLRFALAAFSLIATAAFASPADPKNGAEYTTLSAPQPVPAGNKIEVIEFFMYHCPHCYAIEPDFAKWVKRQGDNITVRRVHMPMGPNDPEAHLYLTLDAMGLVDKMHSRVFHAVHGEGLRIKSDQIVFDWVAKNGIDKAKFVATWNSFGVMTKMKRLIPTMTSYNVNSTPTYIVDGKYMTSPNQVDEASNRANRAMLSQNTMVVLDALVGKAQKEKGLKPVAAAVK